MKVTEAIAATVRIEALIQKIHDENQDSFELSHVLACGDIERLCTKIRAFLIHRTEGR